MFEQELQVKLRLWCRSLYIHVHRLNMCTLYGIRNYICKEYIYTLLILGIIMCIYTGVSASLEHYNYGW